MLRGGDFFKIAAWSHLCRKGGQNAGLDSAKKNFKKIQKIFKKPLDK